MNINEKDLINLLVESMTSKNYYENNSIIVDEINNEIPNNFYLEKSNLKNQTTNQLILKKHIALDDSLDLSSLSFVYRTKSSNNDKISYGVFSSFKEEEDFDELCDKYIKSNLLIKNYDKDVSYEEDFDFVIYQECKANLIHIIKINFKNAIKLDDKNHILDIISKAIKNL
ncbi:hypothetical protein C4D27_17930 [Clostridium perfringens]